MRILKKISVGVALLGLTIPFSASANPKTLHHSPKLAPQYTGVVQGEEYVGFAGGVNTSYFQFPVWTGKEGNVSLKISFASGENKSIDVYVDGSLEADNVPFPDTMWNKNQNGNEVTIDYVWLKAGTNFIRVVAGDNGGPNIYNIAMEEVYPICNGDTPVNNDGWGVEKDGRDCRKREAPQVNNCAAISTTKTPIDHNANYETKVLYHNIDRMAQCDRFIFGAEFPLSFSRDQNGSNDLTDSSDLKKVIDVHAGLHGLDPHFMFYKSDQEKNNHLNAAKAAYNWGGVVTYNFHYKGWSTPYEDSSNYHEKVTRYGSKRKCIDKDEKECNFESNYWFLANIVEEIDRARAGKDKKGEGKTSLDKTLNEIVKILNDSSYNFPVALRLYHEMNGNWFWWGRDIALAEKPGGGQYSHEEMWKILYRYTVDYIKSQTNNVLFVWSPDVAEHHGRDFTQAVESYWPGDNYVDIIGIDYYEPSLKGLRNQLSQLTDFAAEKNKPAVISELGHRGYGKDGDYRDQDPTFWSEKVLAAIKYDPANKAQRIAWLQTWLHQSWSNDYYPEPSDKNSESKNRRDAFKDFFKFKDDSATVFLWEIDRRNADTNLIRMYE